MRFVRRWRRFRCCATPHKRQWKVRCFDTDPGKTTSQKSIVVWLNEFFGEVREGSRSFEQFKLAQDLAPKLVGCVLIRKRNPDTFEDDVQQMLRSRLTFDEAIAAEDFSLVSKQRLQIIRRELFEQLDELDL